MVAIAVISDIHANLEALRAVLRDIDAEEIYCLGDLVDYGAQPNEVIEMIKAREIKCILGNHDWAALTGDTSMFNPRAAMSSIWSREVLKGESVEFLRSLPDEFRPDLKVDTYFTHGSPDDKLWEYVDPETHSDLFGYYLDKVGAQLLGLGHTHIPYVWREGERVVFNPGSVGQPRDGNRRASYGLVSVDRERPHVEIKRVEYDYEKAAAKIRAAGLPASHADRLATGS